MCLEDDAALMCAARKEFWVELVRTKKIHVVA
jgi:hypothetical protein